MVKELFYAVSRKGQGRVFTECPKRDERLGVWVGESAGCISMTVMIFESDGYVLPRISWDDEPIGMKMSLEYG